jgi:hypothetical protein
MKIISIPTPWFCDFDLFVRHFCVVIETSMNGRSSYTTGLETGHFFVAHPRDIYFKEVFLANTILRSLR